MKKLSFFLLIFILASPAVIHACDCCIFNHSDSSQGSLQQKVSDCCTHQMNVSAKECQSINIREVAVSPGSTVSFSDTSPVAYFSGVTALPKPLALLNSSGSPPNFPEKPLFLLHNVLRI